jgi:hypothetical protein
MPSAGKLIVVAIFLLAFALAVGNMVFQTDSSGRAVEHWGPEAARLILTASHVEVLELDAPADLGSRELLEVGPEHLAIVRRCDASHAPGILHFRRALVTDRLYDWNAPPSPSPTWRYALRFREEEAEVVLLLDESCLYCAAGDSSDRVIALRPVDQRSPLQAFVQEQFSRQAAPPRPP